MKNPIITPDILKQISVVGQFFASKFSKFVSLVYTNKEGETARHLVHFGVNYLGVIERDIAILSKYVPQNELEIVAKDELLKSLNASLSGFNPDYTKHGYYTPVAKGVKYSEDEAVMYFNCFAVAKTVIVPIAYKEVKSSAKTIVKNKLRKMLKSNKFREFRTDLTQIHKLKMNGLEIEIAR